MEKKNFEEINRKRKKAGEKNVCKFSKCRRRQPQPDGRFIPMKCLAIIAPVCLLTGCLGKQTAFAPSQTLERRVTGQDETQPVEFEDDSDRKLDLEDRRLTLEKAIRIALSRNPELRIAKHETTIANERVSVAKSGFYPRLSAGVARSFLNEPVDVAIDMPAPSPAARTPPMETRLLGRDLSRAELQAQWRLWDFGRTLGRYRQAKHLDQVAIHQYRRSRQRLIYSTSEAFFDVLRAKAALEIAQAALEPARARNEKVQGLYQGELVAYPERRHAEAAWSEAQQAVTAARNHLRARIVALNQRMGIDPDLQFRIINDFENPEIAWSLEEALQHAIANRPEFKAVQFAIAAAESGKNAVQAQFLPEVYAAGRMAHLEGTGAFANETRGVGELGIRLDLFTGKRRLADHGIAIAQYDKAWEAARRMADMIALQVRQSLFAAEVARERHKALSERADAARARRQLMRHKHRKQLVCIVDVAMAEAAAAKAFQERRVATYDCLHAVKRLQFAMGVNDDDGYTIPKK